MNFTHSLVRYIHIKAYINKTLALLKKGMWKQEYKNYKWKENSTITLSHTMCDKNHHPTGNQVEIRGWSCRSLAHVRSPKFQNISARGFLSCNFSHFYFPKQLFLTIKASGGVYFSWKLKTLAQYIKNFWMHSLRILWLPSTGCQTSSILTDSRALSLFLSLCASHTQTTKTQQQEFGIKQP